MSCLDWDRVRERMLIPAPLAYLNAGSFGPLPGTVHDRAAELRRQLASDPAGFLLRQLPDLLWHAREILAGFVGGVPERLLFASSVSAAVSLIASSLPLESPGDILLSDQEYSTMRWCWERAAERNHLTIRTFAVPPMPADPEEIVEAAVAAFGPRTRLVFFSHIVSANGLVMPAQRLCEEARQRGIVSVVDGAHAVATLALSLETMPCDFYVGSCHKWLLAPSGSSFIHIGRDSDWHLHPTTVSWGYHAQKTAEQDARDAYGSTPRLRRLECEGTRDLCPWLAVPEAVDFHLSFGTGVALARMRTLAERMRERLAQLDGISSATPADSRLSSAMIAFRLPPSLHRPDLTRTLRERFSIEAAIVDQGRSPLLRLSPHVFTTLSDIEVTYEALSTLLTDKPARMPD